MNKWGLFGLILLLLVGLLVLTACSGDDSKVKKSGGLTKVVTGSVVAIDYDELTGDVRVDLNSTRIR